MAAASSSTDVTPAATWSGSRSVAATLMAIGVTRSVLAHNVIARSVARVSGIVIAPVAIRTRPRLYASCKGTTR